MNCYLIFPYFWKWPFITTHLNHNGHIKDTSYVQVYCFLKTPHIQNKKINCFNIYSLMHTVTKQTDTKIHVVRKPFCFGRGTFVFICHQHYWISEGILWWYQLPLAFPLWSIFLDKRISANILIYFFLQWWCRDVSF